MSIHTERSDRDRDGLRGNVTRVHVDAAERVRTIAGWTDGERVALEEARYDAHGNRLEWVFFSETGDVERRYVYTYDDAARRVRSTVSDATGRAIEVCEYAYDSSGARVGDSVLDARRTPAVPYAYEVRSKGSRQRLARARVEPNHGRREVVIFNAAGDAIEIFVYTPERTLDHKWSYTYDAGGRRTSEISYWPDGSFRSKELRKYDARGDEYKVAVYRADGSLSLKWAYTYEHDANGNWITRNVHVHTRELGRSAYRPIGVNYRTIEYTA